MPNTVEDTVGTLVTPSTPRRVIGGDVLVSHPTSDVGATNVVGTEWSGNSYLYRALFNDGLVFFSKRQTNLLAFYWALRRTDLGVQPVNKMGNFLNDADTGKGWCRWEQGPSGLPTGVLLCSWQSGSSALTGRMFAYDDAVVVRYETTGITALRLAAKVEHLGLDGQGGPAFDTLSGYVDTSAGPPVLVFDVGDTSGLATPVTAGRYLAVGFSQPDEIFISSAGYQDPRQPFDTSSQSTVNSVTWFGVGSGNVVDGSYAFAFAMDDDAGEAARRVRRALSNDSAFLGKARTSWEGWLSSLELTNLSDREKYSVAVSLNQIRAHMYGDRFLTDATYIHPYAWVRDNAFAALGAAEYDLELAKDILRFFAPLQSIVTYGTFDYQGNPFPAEAATDRAAIFLWAVGHVWARDRDMAFASELQAQVNRAVDYYVAQYDAVARHIVAEHTHDWPDQYLPGMIDVSLVRYEAEIDLLALGGLRSIAPMLEALGDADRASWAQTTAQELEEALTDYLTAPLDQGGYLAYAIKADGSLYTDNGLFVMPAQLWAALFLGDKRYYDVILARRPESTVDAVMTYPTDPRLAEIDGPVSGRYGWSTVNVYPAHGEAWWDHFFALLDYWWGQGAVYEAWHNLTVLGLQPVWYAGENGRRVPFNKPVSFPWHYGTLMYVTARIASQRAVPAWVSVSDLKASLGRVTPAQMGFDTAQELDAFLSDVLARAQSYVESYLGTDFSAPPGPTTSLAQDAFPGDGTVRVQAQDGFSVGDFVQVGEPALAELYRIEALGAEVEAPFTWRLYPPAQRFAEQGSPVLKVTSPVYETATPGVPDAARDAVLRVALNIIGFVVQARRVGVLTPGELGVELARDRVFTEDLKRDIAFLKRVRVQ